MTHHTHDVISTTVITLVVALVCIVLGLMVLIVNVSAHDADHPELNAWYSQLTQPNIPSSPCCGKADAYWCDDVGTETIDGQLRNFCKITDDRSDWPLGRPHRNIGEKFYIPDEKMKFGPQDLQPNLGNPTGHAVVFLSTGGLVYCFVSNGGV